MQQLSVKIGGNAAQYIREMARNNGVSAKDYTLNLLVKAIADEKREAQSTTKDQ